MAHLRRVISIDEAREQRQAREEPLKTKPEIAAHYVVSERTIERWMRDGFPYDKPFAGGSVRFRLSECETWFSGGAR